VLPLVVMMVIEELCCKGVGGVARSGCVDVVGGLGTSDTSDISLG